MRLATERLVLRECVEDDWAQLFAIESRPEVVRYETIDAYDEAGARAYVQGIMVNAREVPRLVFDLAITRPDDDTYIGRVGMRRSDRDPRLAELWFVMSPEHQGNGYVTEAARALITYAFTELGLHRIQGDCDPRNPASARVMERLGMRREAHHRENIFIKGEWCDSLIYAVLASEWPR